MPRTAKKQTLSDLNTTLVNLPKTVRKKVLDAVGAKSETTYFDIINGERKLNPAEKKAIAEVFERKVEDIDWQEK